MEAYQVYRGGRQIGEQLDDTLGEGDVHVQVILS